MINFLRANKLIVLLLIIIFGYFVFNLLAPVDPAVVERYAVSESKLRIINLSIMVPIAIIWLIGFYGYARIAAYAKSIGDHADGDAFSTIGRGLAFLSFSLPIRSLLTSISKYINAQTDLYRAESAIITNLTMVTLSLISFWLLANGAVKLKRSINRRNTLVNHRLWILVGMVVSALFSYLVILRPHGEIRVYYLPDLLILLLIVVPFSYAWYNGIEAAVNMHEYSQRVKGMLYKESLRLLSAGIIFAVISSVLIQLLIALSNSLNRLNLQPVLVVIYIILLIYGVSFFLIAVGARRLQKIEDA